MHEALSHFIVHLFAKTGHQRNKHISQSWSTIKCNIAFNFSWIKVGHRVPALTHYITVVLHQAGTGVP